MHVKKTDVYKIGYSSKPMKRLKEVHRDVKSVFYEAGLPLLVDVNVEMLYFCQAGYKGLAKKVESLVHKAFKEYRIGNREWFVLPHSLLSAVRDRIVSATYEVNPLTRPRFICGSGSNYLLDTFSIQSPTLFSSSHFSAAPYPHPKTNKITETHT